MNRRQFLTTTASIATTISLASSAVAAQENDTETTTPEPDKADTVARHIDENTRIREWDYSGGVFDLVLESDTVSTVTVSEQISMDRGGTGQFNIQQARPTANNRVRLSIPAEKVDNKAVITLTTSASINQGYGIVIQAGSGFNLFNGPATWSLAGIGALGTFGGTAWGTKRYRESKLEEQEKRQVEEVK